MQFKASVVALALSTPPLRLLPKISILSPQEPLPPSPVVIRNPSSSSSTATGCQHSHPGAPIRPLTLRSAYDLAPERKVTVISSIPSLGRGMWTPCNKPMDVQDGETTRATRLTLAQSFGGRRKEAQILEQRGSQRGYNP
ncbi:hypothetical protein NMY22_g8333 [Coprinellus aureogranulatus]|nr:hypothetical protein NMY22_g8333 [Coprinellus aureogranulatus]